MNPGSTNHRPTTADVAYDTNSVANRKNDYMSKTNESDNKSLQQEIKPVKIMSLSTLGTESYNREQVNSNNHCSLQCNSPKTFICDINSDSNSQRSTIDPQFQDFHSKSGTNQNTVCIQEECMNNEPTLLENDVSLPFVQPKETKKQSKDQKVVSLISSYMFSFFTLFLMNIAFNGTCGFIVLL